METTFFCKHTMIRNKKFPKKNLATVSKYIQINPSAQQAIVQKLLPPYDNENLEKSVIFIQRTTKPSEKSLWVYWSETLIMSSIFIVKKDAVQV